MQNDSVSVVKTHASILIESLKEQGITIKKTQALEIMSRLENRTDWNRLRARLKNLDDPKEKKLAKKTELFDCFVLLAPGGSSKTEGLKALFELECADGATSPVMICMSGDGHTLGNEKDINLDYCDSIVLKYDEFGIIEECQGPWKERFRQPHNGWIVNMVSTKKGSRVGAGLAVSQFLKAFPDALDKVPKQRVGTVMIDGFEQIKHEEASAVCRSIRQFFGRSDEAFRRLLVSSRRLMTKENAKDLEMQIKHLSPATQPYQWDTEGVSVENLAEITFHRRYGWKSESLSDPLVVADMYWLMLSMEGKMYNEERENGQSRISRILGDSSWFTDLRTSLV